MNEKGKKELIEIFEKLDPVNRADVLAHAASTFVTQENTKKALSAPSSSAKGKKST